MSAVALAADRLNASQALLEATTQALSTGRITPEVISSQELAQTQIDAQVSVLKEAIAAEAAVFDLLI